MNTLMRAKLLALATVLVVGCSTAPAAQAPAPVAAAPITAAPTPAPTQAPTAAPTATAVPLPKWDEVPVPAADASGLAAQLVMAEGFIRDPKVTGDQLAWAGHLEQLVLGTLSDYPDWTEQVLNALPAAQRAAVRGSVEAGQQLRPMPRPIPKNLPHRHLV